LGQGGFHVVKTVSSTQCSVFRKVLPKAKPPLPMGRLKHASLLLVLLNTEHWILNTAQAKSLGVHGVIYAIEERDPIALIQKKLKVMEGSGELKRRNFELQKKARASVERLKAVTGITKATKSHVFTYDPAYVVPKDLYDHQGRVFAKKGSKINPLETVSLSADLVFFDGDDPEQLDWVKENLVSAAENKPLKLILTQGAPLKLAEELGGAVYFDQSGLLTKKLGIKHVPAIVSQEDKHLKIEEIKISPSRELKIEGDA
jgi:conjugal transfer pilus assembly protein TraW